MRDRAFLGKNRLFRTSMMAYGWIKRNVNEKTPPSVQDKLICSRNTYLAPNEGGNPTNGIEVFRNYLVILDLDIERSFYEFNQFQYPCRIYNPVFQKRRVLVKTAIVFKEEVFDHEFTDLGGNFHLIVSPLKEY
jgi:hypothetical protein